jgi:hypothetical protein
MLSHALAKSFWSKPDLLQFVSCGLALTTKGSSALAEQLLPSDEAKTKRKESE